MRSARVDVLAPKVAIANVGRMFCIADPPGVDWWAWDYTHNLWNVVKSTGWNRMFENANSSFSMFSMYFYYQYAKNL